jgi:single-strand DNA-binding protein
MSYPSHNLAVISGALSSAPSPRTLPSGDELTQLEVTTRAEGQDAVSVPVSVPSAEIADLHLEQGDEVVVIGLVRRRFFRAGGVTQSRTEVVADRVIPGRRRAAAARAVSRAVGVLAAP